MQKLRYLISLPFLSLGATLIVLGATLIALAILIAEGKEEFKKCVSDFEDVDY